MTPKPLTLIRGLSAEVHWKFLDFCKQALPELGVTEATSTRIAFTRIKNSWRLTFGPWRVIRLHPDHMMVTLHESDAEALGVEFWRPFDDSKGPTEFGLCQFDISTIVVPKLLKPIKTSFNLVRDRFNSMTTANIKAKNSNCLEAMQAIFDLDFRKSLPLFSGFKAP